jgi:hypothetical protein
LNRKIITASLVALVVAGCTGAVVSTSSDQPEPSAPADITASQAPVLTPEPSDGPITEPTEPDPIETPEPPVGPKQVKVGEVATITADDENYLEITVSKPSQHKSYGSGYLVDKPRVKGNVFLQAFVTYKSLQDGADYNQFDWDLFVDGTAVDGFAFASGGPEPQLNSGDLPKGRTAKGWLLYEVPAKGEVVLSYKGGAFTNDAPIFEVVLRRA